jgi:hypothetical protein
MTDDTPQEQSFTEFEAKANEPEKPEEQPAEVNDQASDAPADASPEGEEGDDKPKTRGRPWQQRVDVLTARLRDAERRAAEAEARGGKVETEEQAPDSDKYEFGEADPQFIRDMARFEVRSEIAEQRKKDREADEATAGKREVTDKLELGMANIEKTGAEKYDDFEAKISEAVEARGGEPLHPLVSVGIAVSPAGADVAYKLATDDAAADRLEKLAKTNPHAAALAFGELEGEFVADDDSDLNPADPLDMARLNGRLKARLRGGANKITNAPAPARERARGGSGQFETRADTTDFKSFERLANKAK